MKYGIKIIGILVCLILANSPLAWCQASTGNSYPNTKTTARSEIWKDINSGKACSGTVAIMDNGKIVYAEGFGMADREKSIPVDRNTLFNIGSISKVYCATAMMLLVDEGKVELDKPVITYLPEFTMADPRYKDITVRMLLNHSSGLPGTNYVNSFGFEYNKNFYQETLAILAQSKLKHRPGEMAVYCNDGFTLAEMIVAKLSGKSYEQFLKDRIFKPLALQKTDLTVGQRKPTDLTIARYYNSDGVSESLEVVSFLGSGGLSTTAEELCRFVDSFTNGGKHILSPTSLAEMQKGQPSDFWGKLRSPQLSYGLGWDMTDIPAYANKGINLLGKSGGTGQYTSMVYVVPDKRISVAVITTGRASSAQSIAQLVLDAYLVEKGLIIQERSTVKPPVKSQPLPAEYQGYEGFYVGDNGSLYKVTLDGKKGMLTAYNMRNGEENPYFTAAYADSYFYTSKGSKFYFITVENKRYFVWSDKIDFVLWEKLEPIPLSMQQRLTVDVVGQQWLRRNVKAYEGMILVPTHVLTSGKVEGLNGYVDLMGIKPVISPSYAGLPGKSVRDGTELKLIDNKGVCWIWLSGGLYMNANRAVTARIGQNNITIGEQGYNEWLKLSQDGVLSFNKPLKGRIIVFDPTGTSIYDSEINKGDVFAPAGSLVEMAGNCGDVFQVRILLNQ